jgi:hypothetical protein
VTRWLHGGKPGLKPGRRISPPAETGLVTDVQMLARAGLDPREHGLEADRYRADVVYLTSAADMARGYAGGWALTRRGPGLGTVYEAVPAPGWEPDPDFEEEFPGLCIQAPYASVTGVAERNVTMTLAEFGKVMVKYTTWDAGPCPACGHDAAGAPAWCRCAGCVCAAARIDPGAVLNVRPAGWRPGCGWRAGSPAGVQR